MTGGDAAWCERTFNSVYVMVRVANLFNRNYVSRDTIGYV